MNFYRLNKIPYSNFIILFFSLLINFPAQSATFEIKKSESEFQPISEDLFALDTPESFNMQMIEHVKNSYKSVINLIAQKKYENAQAKITSLIQQDPNQSIYYNLKALLQIINEDTSGAEQSFQKAITLNTRNSQAYLGLAKLALNNKQIELAKEFAKKALGRNPYEVKAYEILADIAMQQKGINAVETLLLEARTQVKESLGADLFILQLLGKVYISQKHPEKLIELADDLVDRNKGNVAALAVLAEAQLINKDDSGAEKTLREMITHQPKDAKHLFSLARLLSIQTGKESETLKLLDQAALNLENPNLVLSYKTAVLIKQKQYQKALAVATQVEASNPAQALGKILKADVYLAEKHYKKAIKHYQAAYKITQDITILDALLGAMEKQQDFKAAVTLLEKELAKHKNNPAIQYRLAVAYQNAKQHTRAVPLYEALLTQQKENVIVLNNLAWAYSALNDPRALSLAERAYKLAPLSAYVADTYGYILFLSGHHEDSISILKQAVELNPTLDEVQRHLDEAISAQKQLTP